MINQTISHYKILEKLGAGGMGVVYKALDTKLNRQVALKFLPQDLTRDQETIDRFINEAQAASALDHTNICTIYEIGETEEGQLFIVMAYYAGETLQKKVSSSKALSGGQLSVDSVIDIAEQAARGLERAHEAGITHRDIKPSNLIITPRGEVKIIDFGLAKLAGQTRLTKTGATVGTVAYMSPEQVQAQPVDHRTDIWSLGVMLYEMLTGKLPFRGDYEAAMIYSIVSEKPEPLIQHRAEASEGLQRIVDKGLAKNSETRYQQIGELLEDLAVEKRGAPDLIKPLAKTKRSKTQPLKIAFAATAILSALIVSLYLFKRHPAQKILPTHKQVTFVGDADYPAISPDGQFIAYVTGEQGAEQKVMIQDIAGGEPLNIYQAKGCLDLRWSPDGAELMLTALVADSWKTYLVPRLGGSSRNIPTAKFQCWSPDGSQIASMLYYLKGIFITNKSTGERALLTVHGTFATLLSLDWSPLGNRLLFLTRDPKRHAIWTVKIDGSQLQKVIEDSVVLSSPRWSANGKAIYYFRLEGQTESLMKVSIAPQSGKANGPAINLLAGFSFGEWFFTLSADNKRLLYTREIQSSNLWLITLKENGNGQIIATKQLTTGTSWAHDPAISPDGSRIAFSIGRRPQANLFVMPIAGGQMQQLTFFDSYNAGSAWSPDGKEIAFGSTQDGKAGVWKINSNGGAPRPFSKSELSDDVFLLTWSPGANILYRRPGKENFHFLNPQTEEEKPLLEKPPAFSWLFDLRYSPDAKSVAVYWNRNEAGKSMPGIWLVSLKNSSQIFLYEGNSLNPIRWSADGKWVYTWGPEKKPTEILKIPIAGGPPQTVVTLPFAGLHYDTIIDLSPDEKQIVCPVPEKQSDVWIMENFDPENELAKPLEAPALPEMQQLTYLQKGWNLVQQKKYAEAEKVYRQGLQLNPKHLLLLDGLGWSLNNQRKYVEAEAAFLHGLEIAPEHPDILNGLRTAAFENKNYEAAKRYTEKYLESEFPQREKLSAYVSLGEIGILQKDYADAENHLYKALAIDSTYASAFRQLGYLRAEQGRYTEAETFSQRALARDSSFANYNLMAWVLVAGGRDIDRGMTFAKKSLDSKPANWRQTVEIYPYFAIPEHTLGLAHLKKGEYEKAVQYLEQAVAFAPERENLKVDLQLARQKLQEMTNK